LTLSAQRKKLGKKETPEKNFALCGGRPTLRALDQRSLFEKSDAKTFKQTHRAFASLTAKSQFV